ncbi:MAG: N-acetyltransferase [Bacteroidales bacterium]|nr:N-acetyltransferase [Bacteroidales bacterium]
MSHEIYVKAVSSSREKKDFIGIVDSIYRLIPQYVPDLESDIQEWLNGKVAEGLDFIEMQPFVAYRDGVVAGRVIGIINKQANQRWNISAVRFSMLEFIDDDDVSKALLETIATWGRERGMTTMIGPMGITDFDKEGMLVEDFELTGTMNTYYNPPYYPRHLERLGFTKETDWIQIRLDIPSELPARYMRVAQYVREQMGLRVIKLTHADIRHGRGHEIFELLNEAYSPLFGFSPLTPTQIDRYVKKYLSLIDLNLIPVVVNEKNECVGVAVTMPTLTRAMQRSKGRLWPTGWFHLMRSLKWKHEESAELLLIAIRPDMQGMGVNALFFEELITLYNKMGILWAETGPQLENNSRELSQWTALKPKFVKRRRCYQRPL